MKKPLVSIIMNCYNGEEFLQQAIESVIAQTYSNWEIIFWDNASTDLSAEIAKSYNCNLRYFRSEKTTSLGEARDQALSYCEGEFIAFLDVDDIWLPNKLSCQIPYFNKYKTGLVISKTIFFSDKSDCIEISYTNKKVPTGNVFANLMEDYFLAIDSVIFRKKVLDNILGNFWFNKNLSYAEEADFFMRISYDWELDYCPEVLSKHRYHAHNLTKFSAKLIFSEEKIILSSLLKLIPDLGKRYPRSVYKYRGRIAYQECLFLWKAESKEKARQVIRPYLKQSKRYIFIYFLTIFSFSIFEYLKQLNIKFIK